MSDKLTDAALAEMKERRWNIQCVGIGLDINAASWWAIDDRAKLLDHIAALNGELEAIKGRLTEEGLMEVLKQQWLDGVTEDKQGRRSTAKAIIAHVLNGEQK